MMSIRPVASAARLCLLFGLVLAAGLAGEALQAPSPDTTVYVTKTGTKYHRAGCSSLSKSAIPVTLKEAAAKYAPCSRCRPPVLAPSAEATGSATSPSAAKAEPSETTVYMKPGSAVYHLDQNCAGLAGAKKEPHRWSEVQSADYGLCSVCARARDAKAAAAPSVTATGATAPVTPTANSGRCQAITKKGTQCTRRAQPGSPYCWQHQKMDP